MIRFFSIACCTLIAGITFPLISFASAADDQVIEALKKESTELRLKADYQKADLITATLKDEYPENGIGYAINLNSLVTRLSWDGQQLQFDQALLTDAASLLAICQQQIKQQPNNYKGYYYCGQAHFALTYLHALRGHYYRAGTHGSDTISYLEKTLSLKPDFVDAKMHLGIAYYYADNLPPFAKALSKFLWFIPSGNSHKSLPYIKQVVERGEFFRNVAKYLYSDLLIDGNKQDKLTAQSLLAELVEAYPENRRFQFRYISLLWERGEFEESLLAANKFIDAPFTYTRDPADVALVRLLMSRAHLGLKDIAGANHDLVDIDYDYGLPSWGKSWLALTRAQLSDLNNNRTAALSAYKKVINMNTAYNSAEILAAAKAGLKQPFKL